MLILSHTITTSTYKLKAVKIRRRSYNRTNQASLVVD